MSNMDTRKTGGGQTVSYVQVRLESRTLLPEQLVKLIEEAVRDRRNVELRVEGHGTTLAAR